MTRPLLRALLLASCLFYVAALVFERADRTEWRSDGPEIGSER